MECLLTSNTLWRVAFANFFYAAQREGRLVAVGNIIAPTLHPKKFQNQAGQSSTVPTSISSCWWWGTGMDASSSTFRPHPERVNRDLFRQLHAVRHGTEALIYSNHSREAAASSYLAIIWADCRWRTLVPPLNNGTNASLASVQALV